MIGLPVPREEMIDCQSWYEIADYHYANDRKDFPSGIVHVDMGSIPQFFEKIRFLPEKYIVISSRSDYGLHYQSEFPPYFDYAKSVTMFVNIQDSDWGYKNIGIPARINRKRCSLSDRYSIKCYSFTEATFDKIPNNVVRWFITNNTIQNDERIVSIPFGINGVDGNKVPGDKIFDKVNKLNIEFGNRPKDMYVNFQFYTNERMKLYNLYQGESFATIERDVPFDDYLDQLSIHNCCLCPPGNGWDCYRVLESLYMGCIPIMELNWGTYFYTKLDLPIIFTKSLEGVTNPVIQGIRFHRFNDRKNWDLTGISLSYWKDKIEKCRELL